MHLSSTHKRLQLNLVNAVHNEVILWDVAANAQKEEENLPATWSPKKSETMVADKYLCRRRGLMRAGLRQVRSNEIQTAVHY